MFWLGLVIWFIEWWFGLCVCFVCLAGWLVVLHLISAFLAVLFLGLFVSQSVCLSVFSFVCLIGLFVCLVCFFVVVFVNVYV